MGVAILISLASVVLGTALALAPRQKPAVLGTIRTFALTAALGVVALHLLPEALATLGWPSAVAFGAGLIAPGLLERAARWIGRLRMGAEPSARRSIALEAAYYGLLVHRLGDGFGLGAFTTELHAGHAHEDVIIALAAHTVPVVAMVVLVFDSVQGRSSAVLRAVGLAAASVAGVLIAAWWPTRNAPASTAWIAAIVAGLLLHVVTHDLAAQAPTSAWARSVDLVAGALGLGVSLLGRAAHHHPGTLRAHEPLGSALLDLSLLTAPALLAGLGAAALLQVFGRRLPSPDPRPPGAPRRAFAGLASAALRPVDAIREPRPGHEWPALRSNSTFATAAVLGAPALGIEAFAVTIPLYGPAFAALRLAGAALLAVGAALFVAWVHGEPPANTSWRAPSSSSPPPRFRPAFDDLVARVGPWIVLGTVLAAFLKAFLPDTTFAPSPWVTLLVVAAVGVPVRFAAAGAAILLAVLVGRGLDTGSVLAALLLAPALDLGRLAWLRRTYGTRASAAALTSAFLTALLIGAATNAWLPGLAAQPSLLPVGAAPNPLTAVAALLLALVLARSLWLSGTRRWLAPLSPSPGHAHPEPPDLAAAPAALDEAPAHH